MVIASILAVSPPRVGLWMGYGSTMAPSVALEVSDLEDHSLILQDLAKLWQFFLPCLLEKVPAIYLR